MPTQEYNPRFPSVFKDWDGKLYEYDVIEVEREVRGQKVWNDLRAIRADEAAEAKRILRAGVWRDPFNDRDLVPVRLRRAGYSSPREI